MKEWNGWLEYRWTERVRNVTSVLWITIRLLLFFSSRKCASIGALFASLYVPRVYFTFFTVIIIVRRARLFEVDFFSLLFSSLPFRWSSIARMHTGDVVNCNYYTESSPLHVHPTRNYEILCAVQKIRKQFDAAEPERENDRGSTEINIIYNHFYSINN